VTDIVAFVSDESVAKRGRTIPIQDGRFAWWTVAVRRQLAVFGIDQKQLAAELGLLESAVSRCINRTQPVYEVLIKISDRLVVAYPVLLPESEEEAIRLAGQRRLIKRDNQVAQIKAGVGEATVESQTAPVVSEHAFRSEGSRRSKRATNR
jgi:transcriptional regulator with XRE-family HTH domain